MTDNSHELPRRRPRDQIVAEATAHLNTALLDRVEKKHGLDLKVMTTLLGLAIAHFGRKARTAEPPRARFTDTWAGHGLTGVAADVLSDLGAVLAACQDGTLVADDERPRLVNPQDAVPEPLTDVEMAAALGQATLSITASMVRIERQDDEALQRAARRHGRQL